MGENFQNPISVTFYEECVMKKTLPKLQSVTGKVLHLSDPGLYSELRRDWPALVPTLRKQIANIFGGNITAERAPDKKIILRVAGFCFVIGGSEKDCKVATKDSFTVIINTKDKKDWKRESSLGITHFRRMEKLIASAALLKAGVTALTKTEIDMLTKVGVIC